MKVTNQSRIIFEHNLNFDRLFIVITWDVLELVNQKWQFIILPILCRKMRGFPKRGTPPILEVLPNL